jgi:hypothetical protein
MGVSRGNGGADAPGRCVSQADAQLVGIRQWRTFCRAEAAAQAAALAHCARETESLINAHFELAIAETGF